MIPAIIAAAVLIFVVALGIFSDVNGRQLKTMALEWGIVMSMLGIVALPIGYVVLIDTTDEQGQAESAARQWAMGLGYTDIRAVCASRDTNGDGYVSCTIAGSRDGRSEIVPVECARSVMTLNSGCRVQRMGMVER